MGKFLGIFLFSINMETFAIEYKFIDFLIALFAIIFYGFVSLIFWTSTLNVNISFIKTKILAEGIPITMLIQYFSFTIIIILSNVRRNDLIAMLRKFDQIDRDFMKMGVKIDYRKNGRQISKNVFRFMLWIGSLIFISTYAQHYLNDDESFEEQRSLVHLWCLFNAAIIMLTFKFCIIGIGRRFSRINEILRSENEEIAIILVILVFLDQQISSTIKQQFQNSEKSPAFTKKPQTPLKLSIEHSPSP